MNEDVEKKISRVEIPPVPDTAPEADRELLSYRGREVARESVSEDVPSAPVTVNAPASTADMSPVDPTVRTIEKILSEDLYEYFQAMSPAAREAFKAKGEETVAKLARLMSNAAIKAKEVLKLIVAWLKYIPGVNKYFLEQESKIKTDKLLELHKRQHPDSF